MAYSIGDGMVALGLAGGIVGWLHITHQSRRKRLEIIHQERLAAMDKGIPLPELPLEVPEHKRESDQLVIPILGILLMTLALGAMAVIFFDRADPSSGLWIAPLPFVFMGMGLLAFHLMKLGPRR
jgi:hypothetical protein